MAHALPSLQHFRDQPGWALSLVLHAAMVLLALWYLAARPVVAPPLSTLPVDLVTLAPTPGPSGASPAPRTGAPRPRPAAAPKPEGVKPQPTEQPLDELSAKLRALAQLSAPDTALAVGGGNGDGGAGNGNGNGGYALRDFIRQQILRRWLPSLSDAAARAAVVQLRLSVSSGGLISDIVIVDQARMANDALFRTMALSARNAALLASPIQMPPGSWPKNIPLVIDLDPKAALR